MKNIIDTGVRGYLKWLQQDQPAIYAAAAPIIAQKVPEAFSDREQSIAMGSLMGLSDDATSDAAWLLTDSGTGSASAGATDVASAANSGAASSSITSAIASIVNGITQAYTTKQAADVAQQLNAQQLQRVAAGLSPLTISSNSLGIPTIMGAVAANPLTSGGLVLALVAGLGLLFALKGKRGSSARA